MAGCSQGMPWPRPVLLIALLLIALLLIAQAAYEATGWLAAYRAVTVTWQACRYLIDLSGKQLVRQITEQLNNKVDIMKCETLE